MSLLKVNNLSVMRGTDIALVDNLSFQLDAGEMLGLVGESGSGKTLTCRAMMRLLPGQGLHISRGQVLLAGRDILTLSERQMSMVRGREIGMIFQNPASHLNPVMTVGEQIAESRRLHFGMTRRQAREDAKALLHQVGIPDPHQRVNNYPHEFSGGMRQRAMIAVALAPEPSLLLADEPTTALDVTVQMQILRLLSDLRKRLGLAVIMVTHDLGVVAQTCDRIAVMYAGRLCEMGEKREVLAAPLHPYTRALIDCHPASEAGQGRLTTITGQPPVADSFPGGCRFHPRCRYADNLCQQQPSLGYLQDSLTHAAACHHALQQYSGWEG